MRKPPDLFTISRRMIRAITERRLLGNQEKLFLRTKNLKSALDGTNNTSESMRRKQLNTGLHSLKRKQQLTKLKLKQRLKSPLKLKLLKKQNLLPKLKLPKPKLPRKPKSLNQQKNSKTSSSTSLRKLFQNSRHLSKLLFQ